jgi:ABC-type transport system involved in cytochrome c biogenesis permease subunit
MLSLVNRLLLYPALLLLTLGIFIGAVWANQSWGAYWSWDPKETWALITLFIYSFPLHNKSMAVFSRPGLFNLYCFIAFASVLMTYLGVNYLLGGMHSYA